MFDPAPEPVGYNRPIQTYVLMGFRLAVLVYQLFLTHANDY